MTTDTTSAEEPRKRRSAGSSLRMGVLFFLFIVGLYLLRWWRPVDEYVILPYTEFLASLTRILLGLTGVPVTQDGTLVVFGNSPLNILEECNGVPALIVFLAAIFSYPARWSEKGIGFLIGLPAIFALNEVRILSLYFIHRYLPPRFFEFMHTYVWQLVIILFAVLLWIYWAERFVRKPGAKGPAA